MLGDIDRGIVDEENGARCEMVLHPTSLHGDV